MPGPGQTVTWIKVQKPVFDLVGVVLSSFGVAGILAATALVLGVAFGVTLILRKRNEDVSPLDAVSLNLARER